MEAREKSSQKPETKQWPPISAITLMTRIRLWKRDKNLLARRLDGAPNLEL
jgi:hypothetical protein